MQRRRVFRGATFWLLILLSLAMGWRFRDSNWLVGGLIGTAGSIALSEGLSRRYRKLQVFVQLHRGLVTGASCIVVAMAAAVVWLESGLGFALLAHPSKLVAVCIGLGVFVGFSTRRLSARAASPSFVEAQAGYVKARLYVLLIAACVVPVDAAPEQVAYLGGIILGIVMHAIERSFLYGAARTQKTLLFATLTEALTGHEREAIAALCKGHFKLARDRAASIDSYSGSMIGGLAELFLGRTCKAIARLKDALAKATHAEQHAKTWILLALAYHDDGDENAVREAIERVKEIEPTCPVATVISITLVDPATLKPEQIEAAHIALLRAEEHARRCAARSHGRITDQLVKHAFDVDYAFFKDGLAVTLMLLGNLRYAEEVLDGVIQTAPRSATGRLHLGMLFERMSAETTVVSEQDDLADNAIINYELAAQLAPPDSITARRAMARLKLLYASKDKSNPGSGGPPSNGKGLMLKDAT